jgi:hypothetical protein
LIFAGIVLAIVVGLSTLVGDVGSEKKLDWEPAGIFGTALGTTLLAITGGGHRATSPPPAGRASWPRIAPSVSDAARSRSASSSSALGRDT